MNDYTFNWNVKKLSSLCNIKLNFKTKRKGEFKLETIRKKIHSSVAIEKNII